MASTRNKNTPINYRMEQQQYGSSEAWQLYEHGSGGTAYQTQWAGNGLMPGQLPRTALAHNPVEIESFLFGINATNLVNPEPPLTPRLKCMSSANLYQNKPVIMPVPSVIPKYQRPQAP